MRYLTTVRFSLWVFMMPIHDWTRLEAGDFHGFHQCWVIAIRNSLNAGLLPPDYMAMAEQITGRPIPDVVTLNIREPSGDSGGIAIDTAPPSARVIAKAEQANYAKRADRVVIRHGRGKVQSLAFSFVGFTAIAIMSWFFSIHPRLFTKVFVRREEYRCGIHSVILDPNFCKAMRIIAGLQFALGALMGMTALWIWCANRSTHQ